MNCRDFQNEFEDRAGLSDAAKLHLKDCADCEKLHREQSHIWQLIESLPEVAAPTDFNHKFRARVAQSKADDFRPAWWKSLRYVVPGFAAVLVLTMFFASQNFFVSTPQPEKILVERTNEPPNLINNEAGAKTATEEIASANANYENANYETASNSTNSLSSTVSTQKTPLPEIAEIPKFGKKVIPPKNEDNFKGYRDIGVNTAPPPILPNGFPGESKTQPKQEDFMRQKSGDVTVSLSILGIETVSENGGLRVVSVKDNSIAEHSGLKTGDLIQLIDGKNPLTNSFTSIGNLTVLRGTQKVPISISNQ